MSLRNLATTLVGLLAIAAVPAHGSNGAAVTVDPVGLLQRIDRDGAKVVAAQLDDAKWASVIRGVETGKRSWLRVAVALHAATDAGQSEMLSLAAGVALVRAPSDVLSKVIPEMSIDGVCGFPDFTDARTDTQKSALAYLDARIEAVGKAMSVTRTARLMQCLDALRKGRRELASPNGPFGHKQRISSAELSANGGDVTA